MELVNELRESLLFEAILRLLEVKDIVLVKGARLLGKLVLHVPFYLGGYVYLTHLSFLAGIGSLLKL